MTANLTITGLGLLKSRMKARRLRLDRRSTLNQKAVVLIDVWIQRNFASEGGQLETKWEPLALSTIMRRRVGKRGAAKGHRILQDTGDLKTNWKHYWNNKMALVRSKTPYAIYHDSDQPRSKLPRRQILPDRKHIGNQLLKLYGRFVRSSLRD